MPPKKKKSKEDDEAEEKKNSPVLNKTAGICTLPGPGPKYKLKTLVGYNDHCASRYRNPAYSIADKRTGIKIGSEGPGPIYYVNLPKPQGFTIGMVNRDGAIRGGPGPYLIPDPSRGPAFSMKWRTPMRTGGTRAGPYMLPSGFDGPAFSIGLRPMGGRCKAGPGPSSPCSVDVVKPKAPAFSLGFRHRDAGKRASPGPYDPYKDSKSPAYSFGIKHSPCSPPLITDCDEFC